MPTPVIEALAELRRSRKRFQLPRIWPEPYIAAALGHRPSALPVRVADVAAAISEFLFEDDCSGSIFVRQVDPVVESVNRVVDSVLRVRKREPRQDYLSNVRNAVAVRIFQVNNVWRVGNENA